MRIQNNLGSMNINRQLGIAKAKLARVTEKLSSGNRINTAADDPAGLSISEKLRSQIRSLTQASLNVQDGISMIQTMDGALQEADAVLHRMRELAIQGANDTLGPEDRTAIKAEIDQMGMELDKIATSTTFNGKYLLTGKYQRTDALHNIPETMEDSDPTGGLNIQASANANACDVITMNLCGVTAADLLNGPHQNDDPNWVPYDAADPLNTGFVPNPVPFFEPVREESGLPTHNGFKQLIAVIDNLCPYPPDDYGPVNMTGIPLVNQLRSELGAAQNRLEHTMANVQTVAENLQAAESRIREADMAKEMMGFTKENILLQSGTAMLAQSNQQPQTILQLLQ